MFLRTDSQFSQLHMQLHIIQDKQRVRPITVNYTKQLKLNNSFSK